MMLSLVDELSLGLEHCGIKVGGHGWSWNHNREFSDIASKSEGSIAILEH